MKVWAGMVVAAGLAMSTLAGAAENKDGMAVIVGNRSYGPGVPAVEYAHNDAEAMKRYVVEVLGYRADNVIDLRDASKAKLETVFGNRDSFKGQLHDWLRPGRSDVVVFYSGHGVPGKSDRRGYLLPVDAHPDKPELAGYPLDVLYANLAKLPAKSVTVFVDACFSGESGGGELIRGASNIGLEAAPVKVTAPNITVLTAAQGNQLASWDPEARHGLFTEYLLRALYGEADKKDYGNGDGQVTLAEARKYLDEEMTYRARRTWSREQKADVQGDAGRVLVAFAGGRMPVRPGGQAKAQAAAVVVPPPPPPPSGVTVLKGRYPEAGSVFRDCGDCPEMVVVPSGSFDMGSNEYDSEKPVHRVAIPRAFAVGKYEVTFDQWDACVSGGGCEGGGDSNNKLPAHDEGWGHGKRPVINVSWEDAQSYVKWLNGKVGGNVHVAGGSGSGPYRLLSESEWEYAARGGTSTKWSCGDSEGCLSGVAVFNANSGSRTASVGSKSANGFGLHDMHGNVFEWVEDCWNESYAGAPKDSMARTTGNCSQREQRGGSWSSLPGGLRSANRDWDGAGVRLDFIGFRIARTLD